MLIGDHSQDAASRGAGQARDAGDGSAGPAAVERKVRVMHARETGAGKGDAGVPAVEGLARAGVIAGGKDRVRLAVGTFSAARALALQRGVTQKAQEARDGEGLGI